MISSNVSRLSGGGEYLAALRLGVRGGVGVESPSFHVDPLASGSKYGGLSMPLLCASALDSCK
eukprot:2670387-Pyramimonas_sp.AAC.1